MYSESFAELFFGVFDKTSSLLEFLQEVKGEFRRVSISDKMVEVLSTQ